MPRHEHEPIQALIFLTGNKLNTLGRLHVERVDELKPMIKYRSPNYVIPCANIDSFSPARRESIQGAAFAVNIPAQVTLEILDTDVNQHVHSSEKGELLKDCKREISKIEGIEKGKMQPVWVQNPHDRLGRLSRGSLESIRLKATRLQTAARGLQKGWLSIGEHYLAERSPALRRGTRRDQRTAVDHTICVTDAGTARAAEEINVRCTR